MNKLYCKTITRGKVITEISTEGIRTEEFKIPDGVVYMSPRCIAYLYGVKIVTIPGSVKVIGEESFIGRSSLQKVVFDGPGLMKIGDKAFYNCESLEAIDIPDGVEVIGDGAFFECKNLKSVVIPESVRYIGDGAFKGCCSLEEIEIPAGVVELSDYTFLECFKLKKVKFNENIVSIKQDVFHECKSLTELYFPDSLQRLGVGAFSFCKGLKHVSFHSEGVDIDEAAFICSGNPTITYRNVNK